MNIYTHPNVYHDVNSSSKICVNWNRSHKWLFIIRLVFETAQIFNEKKKYQNFHETLNSEIIRSCSNGLNGIFDVSLSQDIVYPELLIVQSFDVCCHAKLVANPMPQYAQIRQHFFSLFFLFVFAMQRKCSTSLFSQICQ